MGLHDIQSPEANKTYVSPTDPDIHPILNNYNSWFKMKMFMLVKLPAAFFSGVRPESVDLEQCIVSIPFKWLTQNPFKSMYFASMSMAAEMSTGMMALAAIKSTKVFSMLLVGMKAEYFKKATKRVYFSCKMGRDIMDAVNLAYETKEGQTITVTTEGYEDDVKVATFYFTWSFKVKSKF